MSFSYRIDLSRYTDNQIALMLVEGTISRREFELWKNSSQSAVQVTVTPQPLSELTTEFASK